jgi:U4/U6.U5 tri-snRNP-associated protein 2
MLCCCLLVVSDASGHIQCPYLDTVSRLALDFDQERQCGVSLARTNVYACLTCGRYLQGRGRSSHAYAHSLNPDLNHHVFINLRTGVVYSLPDGYEVHTHHARADEGTHHDPATTITHSLTHSRCMLLSVSCLRMCVRPRLQVFDPSLDDIKFNLHPTYTLADLRRLDANTAFVHALDGTDYLPGVSAVLRRQCHLAWVRAVTAVGPTLTSAWRRVCAVV